MAGVFFFGLLVLLAGCGGSSPARAAASTGTSITVEDDDGRVVTLPRAPHRVLSLLPSATETIIALGAGDRLVGRTRYDRDNSIAALPVAGGAHDPNIESVVGLTPELVVTWSSDKRAEVRRRLEAAGIPTLTLSLQDTSDAFRAVTLLGDALGIRAQAARMLRQLRDSLAETRRLAAADGRRRVFYVVYNDPPMTMGPATFIAQILDVAGGENVFADAGTNWPTVSLEQVVKRDPDIVVLPVGEMPPRALDRLRTEPGWRDLRAIQRGCVVNVPVELVNRPGPNLARAAEQLRTAIHRQGCGG
jgi:iron complex transport system substrate-binding protein